MSRTNIWMVSNIPISILARCFFCGNIMTIIQISTLANDQDALHCPDCLIYADSMGGKCAGTIQEHIKKAFEEIK